MPSRELLALHTVYCKAGSASGAVEYLNEYDRDIEISDVLTSDGTSSGVLDHATWEKLGNCVEIADRLPQGRNPKTGAR